MGLAWAVVAFACEAGFTLMAVPLLGRHGPAGRVGAHHLAGRGDVRPARRGLGGTGRGTRLHTGDLLAAAYLAVRVTAVAFVLWYTCVERLGAGRAGLLTGVAPIAAAVTGIPLHRRICPQRRCGSVSP